MKVALTGVVHAEQNPAPTKNVTVAPLTGTTPETDKITLALAKTCQQTDANKAPTMVVIQPGVFQMGESQSHSVTIPRPFAISRCEVTVGQFKQFIKESGYQTTAEQQNDKGEVNGCYSWNSSEQKAEQLSDRNWRHPGFDQTDQHPVTCVSWQDAQHYIDWLSQRTGALYRLPTEAEWEYAARAGTQSPRYYDEDKQCLYANGAGQEAKSIAGKFWDLASCSDDYIYTAPVASFAENRFDLFDMLGNVNEWVLDCWHQDYTDAPYDGTAWLGTKNGDCDRRVVRGGSWYYDPQYLRSAFRLRDDSGDSFNSLGFRIARAL